MAYDQQVIDAINAELNAAKAPPLVRKAAFEAGLQESGLQNLPYGDRDSLGPFQQRPSQGWGTPQQILNPRYAANKFVTAAMQAYQTGRYSNAGDLAQAVQRSAYPGYYEKHSAQADQILKGLGGQGASSSPSPGSTSSAADTSSTVPAAPGLGGQASDFTGLLTSLLGSQQQQQPVSAPLQAPAFAAQPAAPKGFQPLQPGVQPAAQAQDTLPATLSLLQGLQGPDVTAGTPGASTGAQTGQDAPQSTIAGEVNRQRSTGFHGSGVLELIYNDGGKGYGIKNGQVVNGSSVFSNVWAGHANHVHVAAGRKTSVALGHLAQQMGLHVGENPSFGGVDPVHVPGSYHYKGEAIDVSGDPSKLSAYAKAVEEYNRTHRL